MAQTKQPLVGVAAGVAGVAGAAVGVTAAVILSDPKRREKARKVVEDIANKGKTFIENAQANAQEGREQVEKKAREISTQAEDIKERVGKQVKKELSASKKK